MSRLVFCGSLQDRLPLSIDPTAIQTLQSELRDQSSYTEKYLKKPTHLPSALRNEVDRHATDLWNCVTRIARDSKSTVEPPPIFGKLLLGTRFFALQLVDVARCSGTDDGDQLCIDGLFRTLKLALRLAKHCLG
jgi:hypothetical protein